MKEIPFVENDLNLPIVEFSLGEKTHRALIDTGSQFTFFDQSLNEDNDEECKYYINITAISGDVKKDCDKGEVILGFDELRLNAAIIFIDFKQMFPDEKPFDCVLGNDLLSKHKVKVDYKKQCLLFPKKGL